MPIIKILPHPELCPQGTTVNAPVGSTIRWNNREWRSLSEVARAITGTRWSGPAFFGLRAKQETAA